MIKRTFYLIILKFSLGIILSISFIGAGKSILLECLMGTFMPDKGEIDKKNNLSIGYIPQNFNPDNSMPISVKRFLKLEVLLTRITFSPAEKTLFGMVMSPDKFIAFPASLATKV